MVSNCCLGTQQGSEGKECHVAFGVRILLKWFLGIMFIEPLQSLVRSVETPKKFLQFKNYTPQGRYSSRGVERFFSHRYFPKIKLQVQQYPICGHNLQPGHTVGLRRTGAELFSTPYHICRAHIRNYTPKGILSRGVVSCLTAHVIGSS